MRATAWLGGLLWLLAGLLLAASAVAVIGACALGLPGGGRTWIDFCPARAALPVDDGGATRLALERARTDTLEDRLSRLQLTLARAPDCPQPEPPVEVAEAEPVPPLATVPVPTRRPAAPERPPPPPPPPEPEPPPQPAAPPQDIPEEAWEERDITLLEGCWNLISDYRLADVDTGRITEVRRWQMCFDANGGGRQTLVFDNGVRCNAAVRGRFAGRQLLINDLGDVTCDNGAYIFRREIRCDRRADGTAECLSRQPARSNSGSRVIIRR